MMAKHICVRIDNKGHHCFQQRPGNKPVEPGNKALALKMAAATQYRLRKLGNTKFPQKT
jgi:hypothetical protein